MSSIGIAAFGGAKGVPILGVIVAVLIIMAISGVVGYRLGERTGKQSLRLS